MRIWQPSEGQAGYQVTLHNYCKMYSHLHQLLAQVVDHDVVVGLDTLVQRLELHQPRPLAGQLPLPPVNEAPLGPVLLQQQPRLLLQPLVRVPQLLV